MKGTTAEKLKNKLKINLRTTLLMAGYLPYVSLIHAGNITINILIR